MSSTDLEPCSAPALRRPAAADGGLPLGASQCGFPDSLLGAAGEPRADRQSPEHTPEP